MLLYKVFKKIEKLRGAQCKIIRLQSTAETVAKEKSLVTARKYSKPFTAGEVKPSTDSFLTNLFSGVLNKKIFEYPPVLREEDIDIVLNHSGMVENFLINNPNCVLNNETLEKLKELELFGLSLPQDYGGAGYNETESKFLLECTAASPTIARFLSHNENFGCKLINVFGSEKQKKKYLPQLATGKSFVSFAYLEENPLVDIPKFDGHVIMHEENQQYILNAEKKWVHNADQSNFFIVMAKISEFLEDECQIKFKMLIVDRNTPGVTIKKHESKNIQELNLFEVSFKNVKIPLENALGDSSDANGFTVLKYGLSHSYISDAVMCLHLVKRMINNALQFFQENNVPRNQGILNDNMAYITMYVYALESVIYLITGRFDMYENPDLFDETVLAKILAIECLENVMQNYMQIFQREGLKESRMLEEALNAWQYYSVFDENIEYLKLLVASDALVHGAHFLSKVPNAFLQPYENPLEVLKYKFKSTESRRKKYRLMHNIKMELNSRFSPEGDALDLSCSKLLEATEFFFVTHGDRALNNEHLVIKFAEAAAYIYATVACLSRASTAVCYDFQNYEEDDKIARGFTNLATIKIEQLLKEISNEKSRELYRVIGKTTFKCKEYPAEHPLSRTY